MRRIDALVLEDFDGTVAVFSRTNTVIGTPQARWREITQSGLALDHAGDAVLALRRHPAGDLDRGERAVAQRIARLCASAGIRRSAYPWR